MRELVSGLYSLNLNLARECAAAFTDSTGVSCFVTDSGGQLLEEGGSCQSCGLCEQLSAFGQKTMASPGAHLYGLIQAEHYGGKYIYFCPLGLTCFISPVMGEYGPVAALVGGPVLMVDREEFIQYDLIERLGLEEAHREVIEKAVASVPYIPPDRVSKLSTLLYMCAGYLGSNEQANRLRREQDTVKQQQEIGEYLQTVKLSDVEIPPYPFHKEKEMIGAISEGDIPKSQRLLNELLGHILFLSGGNLDIMKARTLELIALLSRAAVDGGAETAQIFGMNYRYINEINRVKSFDDLCSWLADIMARFTDAVFKLNELKHIDVIHKAVHYMRQNYMNKISLEDVAGHVFLSPSYFSKVFKDEMLCNFNAYLNKIRIDRSKTLLLSENVRMVDVSSLVGFEDQSYFSKVFKKLTGVTPGKFRESRGKIQGKTGGTGSVSK